MELEKSNITDVAIIGAGPVGMFAVFAFGMQKLNCVLIDALDKIGGQCASLYPEKFIYDIPAYAKITGQELVDNIADQIKPFEAKSKLNSFVNKIVEQDRYFDIEIIKRGISETIKARCVVLALGSGVFKPVKLEIENAFAFEEKNIFYFLDDISKFADKNVAIVGGGDSAIDWAVTLSGIAKKVFLIHRREYIKAHPASWDKVQASPNVEIRIPFKTEELIAEGENFKGVKIKNIHNEAEEFLSVDFLIPCFGLKSSNTFLSDWEIDLHNNAIIVDSNTMRTKRNGIYAIGDCVTYHNKRKLIATGFGEAFQCAKDMFNYLHPDKAFPIGHSTSLGLPK